jgi:hypothetical protein
LKRAVRARWDLGRLIVGEIKKEDEQHRTKEKKSGHGVKKEGHDVSCPYQQKA